MTTGSTSYMGEIFVEDLLRMSMLQSKVAVRLRFKRAVLVYIRSV